MPLSKKEMMAEIVRCGKDPAFFCKKYAKISHPMRGSIPFDLYDFQEAALKGTLRTIVLALFSKHVSWVFLPRLQLMSVG